MVQKRKKGQGLYVLSVAFSKYKELPMIKYLILVCLLLLTTLVYAQTPPATETPSLLEQIDLDATRILAGYTATAEAFPIAAEDTDDFAAVAFGLTICSMLLVLIPLAFGIWRMNRTR
jgi:hypothetical protein